MNLVNRFYHWLVDQPARGLAFERSAGAVTQSDVIVPDVSFYQDKDETPQKIDFAKMKRAGAAGCILRAGQGGWADEDFSDYWADSAGLFPRGLYWFWDSRYSPASQAARLKELMNGRALPEMEVWCDYEEIYGGKYGGWKNFAAMMDEIRRLLPTAKLGIYTGYWYWVDHSPNPLTEKAAFEWFGQFPLWLAQYTNNPSEVKIPAPWQNAVYWQFTSTGDGARYGVESKGIDLSYFNGTPAEFAARYGQAGPLPEPEPEEPAEETLTVRFDGIEPEPEVKTTIRLTINALPFVLTFLPAETKPAEPVDTSNRYRFKVDDFNRMKNWGWAEPQGGRKAEFLFYRLYALKPAGGMAQQGTIVLKKSVWRPWIARLQMQYQNNGKVDEARAEAILKWADNPYAGPTQGGVGKWIVADCPAPANAGQFVTVKKIVTANNGKRYGAIDYIDATQAPPAFSADLLKRGVIHRLFQMDKQGNLTPPSGLAYDWYQPVISAVQPYVLMDDLVKA